MGLLTNPTSGSAGGMGSQFMMKFVSYAPRVTGLCILLGILFFFIMPLTEFNEKTYFSENALLPGLVKGEFDEEISAERYLEGLRDEAERHPNDVPFSWIESQLRQIGLEVYTHNFTLTYPLGVGDVRKRTFQGRNVYAILRAPRASSTEALVLSSPYRPPYSVEPGTDVSIALLLASAKFFRFQNYWAKDIIFLITEHEQLGMQAWLEAYHRISCGSPGVLNHGELEARAGAIQAAINLEMSKDRITHLNVKIQGLNGQLPNMDLLNLINRLSMREGVRQMFQGREDSRKSCELFTDRVFEKNTWKGCTSSLLTLKDMMLSQATGIPDGNHGLFHRFGIQAVTLEGVNKNTAVRRKGKFNEADLYILGRIIEGTFRSLNNLLERFHQSFFYYVLPGTSRYVSIGMYMPGFGVLAGGLLILAICEWMLSLGHISLRQFRLIEELRPKTSIETIQEEENPGSSPADRPDSAPGTTITPVSPLPHLSSIFPMLLFSHMVGLFMLYLPYPASIYGSKWLDISTENAVFTGVVSASIILLLIPCIISALPFGDIKEVFLVTHLNWHITKCITLLEMDALAFAVSLSNFSLAYLITIVMSPIALISKPTHIGYVSMTTEDSTHGKQSSMGRFIRILATILCHPIILLVITCSIDTIKEFGLFEKSGVKLLIACVDATKRALMYSVADGYIYGSVNYSVGCLFLLPAWTLLWIINISWVTPPKIVIPPIVSPEASNNDPPEMPQNEQREAPIVSPEAPNNTPPETPQNEQGEAPIISPATSNRDTLETPQNEQGEEASPNNPFGTQRHTLPSLN